MKPSLQVDHLQHCMKGNQSIFDNVTVIFGLYTCACITKFPHILHILGLKDWRVQPGKVKSQVLSLSGEEACCVSRAPLFVFEFLVSVLPVGHCAMVNSWCSRVFPATCQSSLPGTWHSRTLCGGRFTVSCG